MAAIEKSDSAQRSPVLASLPRVLQLVFILYVENWHTVKQFRACKTGHKAEKFTITLLSDMLAFPMKGDFFKNGY